MAVGLQIANVTRTKAITKWPTNIWGANIYKNKAGASGVTFAICGGVSGTWTTQYVSAVRCDRGFNAATTVMEIRFPGGVRASDGFWVYMKPSKSGVTAAIVYGG